MNLIERADAWVNKTMFRPLIIKACQKLHWTQYQFSRWAGAFGLTFASITLFENVLSSYVVMGLAAFLLYIAATTDPNQPITGHLFLRLFTWALGVIGVVLAPQYAVIMIITFIAYLFSEYALTITTIPPADVKKFVDKTVFA